MGKHEQQRYREEVTAVAGGLKPHGNCIALAMAGKSQEDFAVDVAALREAVAAPAATTGTLSRLREVLPPSGSRVGLDALREVVGASTPPALPVAPAGNPFLKPRKLSEDNPFVRRTADCSPVSAENPFSRIVD